MSANYLNENDRLAEAGRILRGETMMIADLSHLAAVTQIVREARSLLRGETDVDLHDWLREAEKVL